MSALLLVAALWELLNNGNSFFDDKKDVLPVCKSENIQSFKNYQNSQSASNMVIKESKVADYLKRKMVTITVSFPDMLKDQADNILTQFQNAIDTKAWEQSSILISSSSYSTNDKKLTFYSLLIKREEGKETRAISEIKTTIGFEPFERFQTTTYVTNDDIQETSTFDLTNQDNIKRALGALEIALVPITLLGNSKTQDHFKQIADCAIKQINSGKYPYGVTDANKDAVISKLESMVDSGFSISTGSIANLLQQKC